MKKGLILALFALVSVVSYSQISWNAKVGMNMSNITESDVDMKIGYNIGVGMEYAFNDTWSIQPSLLFTTKGAKSELTEDGVKLELSANPMYLELPIMAAARFPVSEKMNVVVSAGPYLAYGLGGKNKVEASYKGKSESFEFDVFEDSEVEDFDWKAANRFDAGVGVGVALEISKIIVGVNGSFGLANFADTVNDDGKTVSTKNMNFSIGVGYKF